MNFDMNLVVNSFPLLLIGAGVTIQITVLSTAIGFVIGLVVGVARISHLRPLRLLAEVYVEDAAACADLSLLLCPARHHGTAH